MILKKASAIESTVLSDHKGDLGKEYKAKIRSLFLNLKDKANPGLRTNVVNGKLPVERFCRMTPAVRLISISLFPPLSDLWTRISFICYRASIPLWFSTHMLL